MLDSLTIGGGALAELGVLVAAFLAAQLTNVKKFKAKRYGKKRFAGQLFGLQSLLLLGVTHADSAFDLPLPGPMDRVLLPAALALAAIGAALLVAHRRHP